MKTIAIIESKKLANKLLKEYSTLITEETEGMDLIHIKVPDDFESIFLITSSIEWAARNRGWQEGFDSGWDAMKSMNIKSK